MADARAAVQISIGAQLGSAFKNTFTTANKELGRLGSSIKEVGGKVSQIEAYRKNQKAVTDSSIAYKKAKQDLHSLHIQLRNSDAPSRQLQSSIKKAEREVEKARKVFFNTSNASRQMGTALKENGINTRNLSKEYEQLNKSLGKLERSHSVLNKIQGAKDANMAKRADLRGQMFDAVALGATLYKSIKPAVDFEYAMARVGAITSEAADSDSFKKMTGLARELGRSTQYTASQVADAMQFLGMAGFNTQQILAATPAALNLSIAGNMDLARTADIASNILTGFNLKAEETARVADVLAQANRTTNVSVEMLGYTMKYVAPAAAAVGGTLEETAALAGVLGDAGIQATMSGTMLRAAYLRLAAPAKQGAAALEKMRTQLGLTKEEMPEVAKEAAHTQAHLEQIGVQVFDKKGNMRSMVDILKDMSIALKDSTDQEKLASVKAIFGDRAASGALAIFKHIESGRLDYVLDRIKNANGAAEEMAERLKATTVGAYKEVISATEDVGIAFGSLLLPTLAEGMRGFARYANKISDVAAKYPVLSKYIGFAIVGLIGAKVATLALGYAFTFVKGGALGLVGGILRVGQVLMFFTTVIKAVSIALLTTPLGWIVLGIAAIVGITVLVIKNWDWLKEKAEFVWGAICDCFDRAWKRFKNSIRPLIELKEKLGSMWDSLFGKDKEVKITQEEVLTDNIKDINAITDKAKASIANNSNSSNVVNAQITVNATPDMDEEKVAREVKKALEEQERRNNMRKRSANYD